MIDYNTLRTLLQEMATDQPGRPDCQGCGHERNCDAEGCAILRDALATMEQLYKDCEGDCVCCTHVDVPSDKPPCDGCFTVRIHGDILGLKWQWRGVQAPSPGACADQK